MFGHSGIPLPPAAFAAAGSLQLLTPRTTAVLPLRRVAAGTLAAGSAGLLLGALRAFRSHATTLDPTEPDRARVLVTDGVNKVTRNPMYLGLAGFLAAHAALRGSWTAWLPVGAFMLTVDRFQIQREETALREKFGSDYERYCGSTPRWLGRT